MSHRNTDGDNNIDDSDDADQMLMLMLFCTQKSFGLPITCKNIKK